MLIDSDILIWLTRGHAGAQAVLDKIKPWRISSVTYIELAQGCRNQQELKQVKQGLLAAPKLFRSPQMSAHAQCR